MFLVHPQPPSRLLVIGLTEVIPTCMLINSYLQIHLSLSIAYLIQRIQFQRFLITTNKKTIVLLLLIIFSG